MPTPIEVEKLIKVYQEAQEELIKTIANKVEKGRSVSFYRGLLKDVQAQLKELAEYSAEWAKENVKAAYQEGINNANTVFEKVMPVSDAFSKIHTAAVEVLVQDTIDDFYEALNSSYSSIERIVRNITTNAVINKLTTGKTLRDIKSMIISDLADEGIVYVETAKGRRMNVTSYASLLARSRTREATNTATMNQIKDLGYDLVKISEHRTSCPLCGVLQGRVYSVSGNDKRYPPISVAFTGPYANIHPNCAHVIMPYIEALAEDPEGDRKFSNQGFEIDSKHSKQVSLYYEEQKRKQKLRNNRRQFERYTLAMPDKVPKSFQGFMAMKRSNNDNWKSLQKEYRKVMKKPKEPVIINTKEDAENAIKSGKYKLDINWNKQNRHIFGNKEYEVGKSVLTADPDVIVKKYTGTGRVIFQNKSQPPKEAVETDFIVGKVIDRETAEVFETKKAMIVYSNSGTHVYPIE